LIKINFLIIIRILIDNNNVKEALRLELGNDKNSRLKSACIYIQIS